MSVRITQGSMSRSYLKNLGHSYKYMNDAMTRIETERAFTKVSENPTSGTRAIDIRAKLYRNEQIQDNINVASEQLSMAETALTEINDMASNIMPEIQKALNGANLQAGKNSYLTVLDAAKQELVRVANTKYNDRYVIGGTSVEKPPYTVDADGDFCFNGFKVSEIKKSEKGEYYIPEDSIVYDDLYEDTKIPHSDDAFIDIGLDLYVNEGIVNPRSAYKVSVSGIDNLGYGRSDVTYGLMNGEEVEYNFSNNLYDIMTEMENAINEDDKDKLSALYEHFKKQTDNLISGISEVGVRSKYLETTLVRFENENLSLSKMQKDTEGINEATEITNFLGYKNAWNLTMQFGSNIVPKSLMDYVM